MTEPRERAPFSAIVDHPPFRLPGGFSPCMGQLADLNLDAVFAMETGADATRLIQT